MICQWFSLKTTRTVFSDLASKPVVVVGFLVEPQHQGGGSGFSGLGFKTDSCGLVIWSSKSAQRFLGLDLKNEHASVYRLRHKTDGGCDGVGHASRSSSLLHVKASLSRVSQSGLKTDGDATVSGACGTTAEVVSKSS
jgi:hypothetical protein